jgi:hypothetical protein
MINFFRKIRQNLLMENKTGKYFKYAIGEIILVVIGILIAVQINNWNQNRKSEIQKRSYIESFIGDLKTDLKNIEAKENYIKEQKLIIENLIHLLNTGQHKQEVDNSIQTYFKGGWIIPSFTSTSNTYTNISQSGKFELFGNSDLSKKIIEYYVEIDKISKSQRLNIDWVLTSDSKLSENTSALEIDNVTKVLFKDKDISKAFDNLVENKEMLERNAATHYWIDNDLSNMLKGLKINAINLIQLLEDELNK